MRAQNEAPATVVRLVRGEIEGSPDPDVPRCLARRARRRGGIRRGPDLAAERRLAAGRARGRLASRASACSTSAPRRAARRRCSTARSSRSRRTRRGHASWRRTSGDSARRTSGSSTPTVVTLPAELTGFDRALVDAPCSGLGVLASRPDLRWRSQPLPELQLELCSPPPARVRPGGTVTYSVCTVNADEAEAVVDAVGAGGLEVDARSRTSGRGSATRPRPSSCRPCRTCTARAGSSSRACVLTSLGSCAWAGATWIRDGREIEPSLYAADFTRLGEQIDALLAAGCRIFHFDVGDGALRPPGHDRARSCCGRSRR